MEYKIRADRLEYVQRSADGLLLAINQQVWNPIIDLTGIRPEPQIRDFSEPVRSLVQSCQQFRSRLAPLDIAILGNEVLPIIKRSLITERLRQANEIEIKSQGVHEGSLLGALEQTLRGCPESFFVLT
jgi:hypothetical protein